MVRDDATRPQKLLTKFCKTRSLYNMYQHFVLDVPRICVVAVTNIPFRILCNNFAESLSYSSSTIYINHRQHQIHQHRRLHQRETAARPSGFLGPRACYNRFIQPCPSHQLSDKMTVSTELPPMGKVSMIGIWVETLLYGMSCFVLIVYRSSILANSQASSKSAKEWHDPPERF